MATLLQYCKQDAECQRCVTPQCLCCDSQPAPMLTGKNVSMDDTRLAACSAILHSAQGP